MENNIIKQWFDQNKQDVFPDIKDFSDPQDHIRKIPVKKMTYKEWFWFSPTAFTLINYGMPFAGAVQFFLMGSVFAYLEYVKAAWVFTIICILLGLWGYYKVQRDYKYYKDTTFYDLYMREH